MASFKKLIGSLAAATLGAATLVATPQGAMAQVVVPEPSAHYDMSHDGTSLTDVSGNNYNGTIVDIPDSAFETLASGHNVMTMNRNGYVSLPQGPVTAVDNDFTVELTVADVPNANAFAWVIGDGVGAWNTWELGNYVFLNPRDLNNNTLHGIRVKVNDAENGEIRLNRIPGTTQQLPREGFSTLTMTSNSTATGADVVLYYNGDPIAELSHTMQLTDIIPDGDVLGYLGRSLYEGDSLFAGTYHSVKIWDEGLTQEQVQASVPTQDERDRAYYDLKMPADFADQVLKSLLGANASADAITTNVTPPAAVAGFDLTWESSNPDVIAVDGTVARPGAAESDAVVTLTATDEMGETYTYDLTVKRLITGNQVLDEAYDALEIHNAADMRNDFSIPLEGANGVSIAWELVDDGGIATIGEGVTTTSQTVNVTRPADTAVDIVLRATLTEGSDSITKEFTVTVQPAPAAAEDPEAYFWAFFTGEGLGAEKISFAASQGNDILAWNTLNDGQPYLESTEGTQGLRDPFIIRSAEGDKFYLLATDLKIAGLPGGFDTAQRSGSLYLEIWESNDLINWSQQRHVRVSDDYAGNTWAPEAFYLEDIDKYVVYWASNLYPTDNPADRTSVTYNRMMYTLTDDFVTFSEPQVWIDVNQGRGMGTIDVTAVEEDGVFYRLYKDESNMTLRLEQSTDFLATHNNEPLLPMEDEGAGRWNLMIEQFAAGLPNGVGTNTFRQGEGPDLIKSNPGDVNGFELFAFIDQPGYHGGPNHYVPFATAVPLADATADQWVSVASKLQDNLPQNTDGGKPRHGTVIPVTRAEYEAILAAYQPDLAVASAAVENVETTTGVAPALPETADLTMLEGDLRTVEVVWDSVPASRYAEPGSFTVSGVAQDAARTPVETTVTVIGPDKSALAGEIAAGEALQAADYTDDSWATFSAALTDAQAVMDDNTADQASVDAATTALAEARAALVAAPTPVEPGDTDKSLLAGEIAAGEALQATDYTDDSWAAFSAALTDAQAVMDDTTADQAAIDAATEALAAARAALVATPGEEPTDPATDPTGGPTTQPTDPATDPTSGPTTEPTGGPTAGPTGPTTPTQPGAQVKTPKNTGGLAWTGANVIGLVLLAGGLVGAGVLVRNRRDQIA